MTLFRKVFQSQAREAEANEVLDSEKLQKMINAAPASQSHQILEPEDCYQAEQPTVHAQEEPEVVGDAVLPVLEEGESAGELDRIQCGASERATVESKLSVEQNEASTELDFASVLEKAATSNQENNSDRVVVEVVDRATTSVERATLPCQKVDMTWDVNETASADQTLSAEKSTIGGTTASVPEIDPVDFAREQIGLSNNAETNLKSTESVATIETVALKGKAPSPELDGMDLAPSESVGRSTHVTGRVRTRLLGFHRDADDKADPLQRATGSTASRQEEVFPVGWLVVVDGPGKGQSFTIFSGASMIGRGEDQVIRLDFGDTSISRHNHAAIAYDEEVNKFYIGHGGKSNIIRRNARPVLSTEELNHADLLRIGETTLRFVALCGADFHWGASGGTDATGL